MNEQKKIGNKTEVKLCELLQQNGYWCHLLEYNKNGQPCDIVALRGNKSFLIDVKHCDTDRFSFNRIEPNQRTCFEYARKECGVHSVGFAIYFENVNKFYWLPYSLVANSNLKSVTRIGLKEMAVVLYEG